MLSRVDSLYPGLMIIGERRAAAREYLMCPPEHGPEGNTDD
jgi:hypothetical protein